MPVALKIKANKRVERGEGVLPVARTLAHSARPKPLLCTIAPLVLTAAFMACFNLHSSL